MKIQVYSAIIGNRCPVRADGIFTFTDYNHFTDSRRNAKIYKILPHLYFPNADWTIWIDGNVILNKSPEDLVSIAQESGKDIMVQRHTDRDCIYQEADVCNSIGYKDSQEQIARYRKEEYPEHNGLGCCFFIVRKNTPHINTLNEKWWAEICTGSVRDQISFPYVFRDNVHYLDIDNFNNNQYTTRK